MCVLKLVEPGLDLLEDGSAIIGPSTGPGLVTTCQAVTGSCMQQVAQEAFTWDLVTTVCAHVRFDNNCFRSELS